MNRRRPVIAGNWKMNTTPEEGEALARSIARGAARHDGVDVVICPPFTGLAKAVDAARDSNAANVFVGAQNMSAHDSGAYTGEVSASMISGLVTHVIVGHSERRTLYCETDADVALKATAANTAGLIPIVCVGESLETRKSGNAIAYLRTQLRASLDGFDGWGNLIVAYEPVWAIGSGEAASPQQADEVIAELRLEIASLSSQSVADGTRILYGGSVNSRNIGPFIDRADIDGALVGGASLQPDEFLKIVEMTARLADDPA